MSPIPHKLNWTGCVRSFCESGKGCVSKRLETMAFQKIYFLLCLTFVDSRLWMSTPRLQPQGVCIQRQSLWVVLAVFVGFCWWGQSVRRRHLSSFFLIVDASFLRYKVFLCWVSRSLAHFVGLIVEIDLFSVFDRCRPRGGQSSEIFQRLRGLQWQWFVCSRLSRCCGINIGVLVEIDANWQLKARCLCLLFRG